jgi:hypothetical protein
MPEVLAEGGIGEKTERHDGEKLAGHEAVGYDREDRGALGVGPVEVGGTSEKQHEEWEGSNVVVQE